MSVWLLIPLTVACTIVVAVAVLYWPDLKDWCRRRWLGLDSGGE